MECLFHFYELLDMSFSLLLHFLQVFSLHGDQCLLNTENLSCFSGGQVEIVFAILL